MDARRIGPGVLAGLAGGVAFGVLMQMMGMIGMVAGLVGADGAVIGWLVHLFNSAVIGALYGATFGQLAQGPGRGAAYGLAYGVVWWVLGALIIMPLWLGMPALQVGATQMQGLIGHLVYGAVTGLVFHALVAGASVGARAHGPTSRR